MSTTTKETLSLRDAIIDALATAGVDGMDFDDLDNAIEDTCQVLETFEADDSEEMAKLVSDGIVEEVGCSWARLARPEWERRVAIILADAGVQAGTIGLDAVAKVVMAALMPVAEQEDLTA